MTNEETGALLGKLRDPFPENQVSKLPKESKAQADQRKADRNSAVNCKICGGWHHKNAVHLDYVGHAALTDRLLDTDIEWSWEPLAYSADGLPLFDRNNGLWIKLTVQGVSRFGYGAADGKQGGDAIKEIIGDAMRNAAMRFGAALDLWHKGELHTAADASPEEPAKRAARMTYKFDSPYQSKTGLSLAVKALMNEVSTVDDAESLADLLAKNSAMIGQVKEFHPGWWDGSETKEGRGMDEQIADRFRAIEAMPERSDYIEDEAA